MKVNIIIVNNNQVTNKQSINFSMNDYICFDINDDIFLPTPKDNSKDEFIIE